MKTTNQPQRAMNDSPHKSFFWDCYARCYDGLLQTIPYQRLLARTLSHVPSNARTLLDAGCGTGNLLSAVHRELPDIQLSGIDFSTQMLGRARRKMSGAHIIQGDLNAALPYADGSFDVVTCVNVLYAVATPEKTLAELKRVLAPGGTLIVSSPLAKPRIGAFIAEHARELGWWRTLPMLGRLAVLILFNLLIVRRGQQQTYHFLDFKKVRELFQTPHIQSAYSNQNWFASVTKGAL